MRINQNHKFNERFAQSDFKEIAKKIFIVCEGSKTEPLYLSEYAKKRPNDDVIILDRSNSNAYNIFKEIEGFVNDKKMRVSYAYALEVLYSKLETSKLLVNRETFSTYVKEYIADNGFDLSKSVTKPDLLALSMFITTRAMVEFCANGWTNNFCSFCEYDENVDHLFLVADRDSRSFTEKQYDLVLKGCQTLKVSFICTNPCIEFWFLLSHVKAVEIDRLQMLKNKKSSKNTYAYHQLKGFDSKYGKSGIPSPFYYENYDKAKAELAFFEQDINKIKHSLGSNITMLIDSLK